MKTKALLKDIGIVVVSDINRETCQPIWMFKHNLLSLDEVQQINDKDTIVSKDLVRFSFGKIELICDNSRLQVRSRDISLSNRLSILVENILKCNNAEVKAIGINSLFRFAILNESDLLIFNHRIAPLNGLSPLTNNGLLSNITVVDWSEQKGNGIPQKSFNIQRVQSWDEKMPAIQISMNAHFTINEEKAYILKSLRDAAAIHSEFFLNSQKLIDNI